MSRAFENAAKIKLNAIHYRGASPAINDVMGGHTNMMMVSVSLALPPHREGKVKMLSIGSEKRLAQLPEFPTTAESGKVPGYIAGTWFGMAVTAGTPRPIVDKLNADVRAVMAEPAFKQRFLESQYRRSNGFVAGAVPGLHPRRDGNLGQGDPRAESRHRTLNAPRSLEHDPSGQARACFSENRCTLFGIML